MKGKDAFFKLMYLSSTSTKEADGMIISHEKDLVLVSFERKMKTMSIERLFHPMRFTKRFQGPTTGTTGCIESRVFKKGWEPMMMAKGKGDEFVYELVCCGVPHNVFDRELYRIM